MFFVLVPRIVEAKPLTKSEWIHYLALCESSERPRVRVVDSNGYYSYGRLQFQLGTWKAYGAKFGASRANIYDGALQEKVAISMLDKGENYHWRTCSKRVTAKYGKYPR